MYIYYVHLVCLQICVSSDPINKTIFETRKYFYSKLNKSNVIQFEMYASDYFISNLQQFYYRIEIKIILFSF